jgi:hypothetical protein
VARDQGQDGVRHQLVYPARYTGSSGSAKTPGGTGSHGHSATIIVSEAADQDGLPALPLLPDKVIRHFSSHAEQHVSKS